MAFCVYIIYSKKLDKYYVGYTENISVRLEQHNSGLSSFTSKTDDWQLVYQELFTSRFEAMAREKEIKKKKSRNYIEFIISNQQNNAAG